MPYKSDIPFCWRKITALTWTEISKNTLRVYIYAEVGPALAAKDRLFSICHGDSLKYSTFEKLGNVINIKR